uniref:Twisted gastrulation BMP signaling modulator 1 n=1 Tax=Leptobrachium leishanense TaxID=445787 RepID=A0A8C5QFJ7_9ANUR
MCLGDWSEKGGVLGTACKFLCVSILGAGISLLLLPLLFHTPSRSGRGQGVLESGSGADNLQLEESVKEGQHWATRQYHSQELCQCRPIDGNCSCCKECMLCLGTLWDECCDCVGMCNPRNYSDTPPTSKSTVEELHEPIPSLFRALTEGEAYLKLNIVSFPIIEELSHHENLVSFLETVNQPQLQNATISKSVPQSGEKEHMCTVAFFDDCMSIHQCKASCESMGASKYRWFHNACCECIGPECIDYGSKTVKCTNCMF